MAKKKHEEAPPVEPLAEKIPESDTIDQWGNPKTPELVSATTEPEPYDDGTRPEPPAAIPAPVKRRKRTKAEMIADLEKSRISRLSPIEAFTAARLSHDQKIKEAEANIELAQRTFEEARDARDKFIEEAKAALGF